MIGAPKSCALCHFHIRYMIEQADAEYAALATRVECLPAIDIGLQHGSCLGGVHKNDTCLKEAKL